MLSPDNVTHDDAGTQGYNRYTYAFNNPLKYTDPDGENPFLIAAAIGGAIGVISNGIGNQAQGQNFFKGAGTAFFFGVISGFTSFGIGSAVHGLATGAKLFAGAVLHGTSASGIAVLQGQTNGLGAVFLSGAVSSLTAGMLGNAMSGSSKAAQAGAMVLFGGLSGGISSHLAGGSFMQGFSQGIITAGLNHGMHEMADAWREAHPQRACMKIELRGKTYLAGQDITEGVLHEYKINFVAVKDKDGNYYWEPKGIESSFIDKRIKKSCYI